MSLLRSYNRAHVLLKHLTSSRNAVMQNCATMSTTPSSEDEVLFEMVFPDTGASGYMLMTLNRPKALNALNMNMIDLITPRLKAMQYDDAVNFTVIRGSGEKAFCAGGDIRAVTEAGKINDPLAKNFFNGEYSLNYLIGTLNEPYIAIIDGITMGGGVGLSVHCPFRIATETTTFAMPETAIGLFPDVGGGYFLPRLSGELGMFLALTGQRLKGRDVQNVGVATHFIGRDKIPSLLNELSDICQNPNISSNSHQIILDILNRFHKESTNIDPREFSLQPHLDQINHIFSAESVEEILEHLKTDGSEWAQQHLKKLLKMSPTSMKVTHRQLKEGRKMSFADCFVMEYRLARRSMMNNDFYEGVRAVLVDRDNSPNWNPSSLKDVTNEKLDSFFNPFTEPDEQDLCLV